MKIQGVYQIRNTLNGKRYIGGSINIDVRWQRHRSDLRRGAHHAIALQRAWNKYGEAAFVFEVLERCALDQTTKREQLAIDSVQQSERYNSAADASANRRGTKWTPEERAKRETPDALARMRALAARTLHTPDAIAKAAAASRLRRGRRVSERSRARHVSAQKTRRDSERATGRGMSEAGRDALRRHASDPNNPLHSPEAIARMSATARRRRSTHDARLANSRANGGRPVVGFSGRTVLLFESAAFVRDAGFDPRLVNKCAHGERTQHGGFEWAWAT